MGGKKVIEKDLDARIDVMEVVYAAQDYMKSTKKSNYARDLKALGKKVRVKVRDGALCIYGPNEENHNDGGKIIKQGDYTMIYTDGSEDEPSIYEKKTYTRRKDIKVIDGYTQEELEKICPLLKDHREKEITHDQAFMLATSMVYISSGEQIFMESIKEHKTKWRNDIRRVIIGKGYCPERCVNGGCPYTETCKVDSLHKKLSEKIRRIEAEKDYFPIAAASAALKSILTEIIEEDDEAVHIVKGQTALGKTEVYCNLVKENKDKKFLIAVPTIVLQNEVTDRLRIKGVECYKTVGIYQGLLDLDIPKLTELIKRMTNKGMGKYIRKAVQKYIKENEDEFEAYQIRRVKEILNEKVPADAHCIVTTHALLLLMNPSMYADYEVIVDEDILMSIFKTNYTILLEDIETAIDSGIFCSQTVARLYEILRMKDGETSKTGLNRLSLRQVELLYENEIMFQGALPLLFESSVLGMDKKKQAVLFFVEKKIPAHKMIIVSASANKNLYVDYLKNRVVEFCEIPLVKYTGELIQYTAHTMSRECINKYGKEEILEGIKGITGDCPCISFKMVGADAITHFGNTEGLDIYAGKDISVLGTPHCIPLIYKIFGEYLGYVNDENMSSAELKEMAIPLNS